MATAGVTVVRLGLLLRRALSLVLGITEQAALKAVNHAEFVPSKARLWAVKKDFGFFDLAPDGKRLALALNEESNQKEPKGPTQVTFLLNFFDELRRHALVRGK